MSTTFNPEVILQNLGPEVKSFIYQSILDLEPFSTPQSIVSVVAKNPLELLSQVDEEISENTTLAFDPQRLPKRNTLRKMFRIAISITEEGQRIESEGLHENVYDAIKIAKDHLVDTLTKIQNDVISSQDRHMQIRHALDNGSGIH